MLSANFKKKVGTEETNEIKWGGLYYSVKELMHKTVSLPFQERRMCSALEKWDCPTCYKYTIQRPASVMVGGF